MNLNDTVRSLINEARALRAEMEGALLRIEPMPVGSDMITSIFLTGHAINGAAGVFILDQVVFFSRAATNLHDSAQQENLRISMELKASLRGALDQLSGLTDVLMLCDLAECFDRLDDFTRIAHRLLGKERYEKLCRVPSLEGTLHGAVEQLRQLIGVQVVCEPVAYLSTTPPRAALAH